MRRKQTIVQAHKDNFDTLCRAVRNHDVALMECLNTQTNERVAVVCATAHIGEDVAFTPLCVFLNGNPYEILAPPDVNGGFHPIGKGQSNAT